MISRTEMRMRSNREGVCGNIAVQFQSCDGSSYCTGLPDWAISRELGYPKVLLATGFFERRFANLWATRKFDERILGEQILSFSVSLSFSQRFSNYYILCYVRYGS